MDRMSGAFVWTRVHTYRLMVELHGGDASEVDAILGRDTHGGSDLEVWG